MEEKRTIPVIPMDVMRDLLIESGHRCAVCGNPLHLERAHIVAWSKGGTHDPENLIVLCANCHSRADLEGWGAEVLREYKRRPWILREYERSDTEPRPRGVVSLALEGDLDSFDDKQIGWIQNELGRFLDIDPSEITIRLVQEG